MKDKGSQHTPWIISRKGKRSAREYGKSMAKAASVIRAYLAEPEKYRTRYKCVFGEISKTHNTGILS